MTIATDTRSRIIAAAKPRFHSRSYANVGIQEICESAGVQKGSFYHFFPSKRDLVIAVIEEFADDWANGFVAEAFDPALPPMERIDYLIDAAYFWQKSIKQVHGRMLGCIFGNLTLEVSTQDDIVRAKLLAIFSRAKSRFQDTLDQAVASGVIAPLDTSRTAEAMLAYLEGVILLAKSQNDPELLYRLGPAIKTLRVEKAGG
ncbi:MAG TPA: TetR/AcrR family transcriptional regulator [Thiobacillus sp.]|nr:TetR/AcrR family transcriptional regulator [Thiobacillus sp.]